MEIIPAIDLRGGRVVRLAQGDYARETVYPVDPVELAAGYAQAGARWLHVVDLDGARSGSLDNLHTIEALAGRGLRVQAGGGIRSIDDVARLRDAGVERIVVGSLAVREPATVAAWIFEFGADAVCVALDTRADPAGRWLLPVQGWTQSSAATLEDFAPRFAACGTRHVLCTDIARDGMLSGPNLALYALLRGLAPRLAVQASGGVRGAGDIAALRASGAAAVILGRSLLEGTLTVEEALAC
jgi:phosphoribosylformimino-5-aminoimidazole carboxamide ribotide isomerase